ncbi:MAG: pyruvate formate lyase family protein [Draconibacterium sp.]|nr:pyruvate formate lyase family protein [Draconibacterium sp.]
MKLDRRNFINLTSKGIIMSTLAPPALFYSGSTRASNTNVFKETDNNHWVRYFAEFTETYKKNSGNIYKRELESLKMQMPMQMCNIQPNDLLVGRVELLPIGFTPQSDSGSFAYYMNEGKIWKLMNDESVSMENKKRLEELADFWRKEDTKVKVRNAYPNSMAKALPSDNWNGESGIAFPLYRMSGTFLDIKKLITLGLPGLKSLVLKKAKTVVGEKKEFYQAMAGTVDIVADLCIRYAEMAANDAKNTSSSKRKKELLEMESVLRKIAVRKPETLKEAVQLSFIFNQFSGSFNYGRYDEFFGDFYTNDLKKGIITKEEATKYFESLFQIIDDRGNVFDSRVVVGGRGRSNEKTANELALVLMQAHHNLKNVTPQFTFRYYDGLDERLWNKALDMIGDGCSFPLMYNDDVNIPAVQRAFDIPVEEAQHYMPFGCGEYVINHRSVGTPSGVINLLQALNVTLHKGINPTTGKKMGIPGLEKIEFDSFETLWENYKKQVEYHVDQLALQEELEYNIAAEVAPHLMFSLLFDDCIERGKPIFGGGIRYMGGTLETYGNTNTADSFTAIKKLVFDENRFSLDEMIKMLDADFDGFEKERKWMLESPKYGNDDDIADNMLLKVDNHIFNTTRNQRLKTGLHSYLVVNINNNANTVMGGFTTASPDGRKGFTYMANANTPTGGMDKNGITAMINSIVKPDPGLHAGMVQNMKFSKGMFNENREIVDAVLKTYFEKGGTQCMISVMGREDLEMAI